MKIALICDWFHPRVGGIELHLEDLAGRLRAAGHDVRVITPTPGAGEVSGTVVHRIDAPRVPRFGFVYTPGALARIGEVLAQGSFDVAHCHVSIVSPAAMGGAIQACRLGIPTVVTFHSIVPQTHLLARAVDAFIGSSRLPAVFTAVSNRVAREVTPLARGRSVGVLPNGVDAGWWRVSRPTPDARRPTLTSVMRLNPKKRPLAIVDILREVLRVSPDLDVRWRVVGDGPERVRLERAITRAGLDDRITLLGRRTRDEIRALYATSDVFVLPTVRESFGLAALEARCAGLPVVARADSGVSEVIESGVEGLLGASDDELAAHIVRLGRDETLRERISAHNRATSPAVDWPSVVAAHERVYDEAMALPVPKERSA